ncbi:MAG: hypothetical protein M0Q49_07510 [Porticoccaceae bacterium]|nr:hypothetical protein [Porticoccaceae bacterium]
MKYLSRSTMTIAALLSLFILAGCEKQGPAERAGEAIDDTAREARDQMEDARDELQERRQDAQECIETEFNEC